MPPKAPIRLSKLLLPTKPTPRAAAPSKPHGTTRPPTSTSIRYLTWASHGTLFLCGALFFRDYFLDYQHVKGVSMAPTLNPRAHETGEEDSIVVVAWRAGVEGRRRKGWFGGLRGSKSGGDSVDGVGADDEDGLKRGDIVTFWKPHRPSEISIKRVVGLPGDTIYPSRGYALDPHNHTHRLAGLPDGLQDEDEDAVSSGQELGKVVVPYGHLWLEGDNWRKSLDSNDFGPISKGLIIGRAKWVWRGWLRFGEVGDARERKERERTRVVRGRAEVPARFLE